MRSDVRLGLFQRGLSTGYSWPPHLSLHFFTPPTKHKWRKLKSCLLSYFSIFLTKWTLKVVFNEDQLNQFLVTTIADSGWIFLSVPTFSFHSLFFVIVFEMSLLYLFWVFDKIEKLMKGQKWVGVICCWVIYDLFSMSWEKIFCGFIRDFYF